MLNSMSEAGSEQDLSITVALAYHVSWYTSGWWSESSHAYDSLEHGGEPYTKMPKTVVAALPDDTLAVVLDRAGEALGVVPGPDAIRLMKGTTERLSSMLFRIGFYRPADEDGFDVQHSYRWKNRLPVVDMDGNVTYHPCQEVTYRQLLVSAAAGLIEGDVQRPYICPSMPQGDVPGLTEVAHVSVEAAKAAYAGFDVTVEQARQHVDDMQRIAFLAGLTKWLSTKLRRKKTKGDPRDRDSI